MNNSFNILIVDDNPKNLQVLGDMLEEAGYEVRIASSGPELLHDVSHKKADLILLDIMLPGMDGFEICRRLKSDDDLRQIPVIIISALGMTEHKVQAFREGAVDYVTKPFQAEEVLARVKTHIQLTQIDTLKREIQARIIAEEETRKALLEKEMLIRELYHRTKNTMQVIQGIITLQAHELGPNPLIDKLVKNTVNRINAISLVHQMLYKSQNLSHISLRDYIQELATLIKESYSSSEDRITLVLNVLDQKVLLDTAIPLGLILNELITNSIQHGYPELARGTIHIELNTSTNGYLELRYTDDGIGLPPGFDPANQSTLGTRMIHTIAEGQMNGTVTMTSNQGMACTIRFPVDVYGPRV